MLGLARLLFPFFFIYYYFVFFRQNISRPDINSMARPIPDEQAWLGHLLAFQLENLSLLHLKLLIKIWIDWNVFVEFHCKLNFAFKAL